MLVRASGSWRESASDVQLAGRRQALAAGGVLLSGLLLPGAGGGFGAAAAAAEPAAVDSIYDLSAMQYGEEAPLSKYRGQVRYKPWFAAEVACPLPHRSSCQLSSSCPRPNTTDSPSLQHPCPLPRSPQVLLVVNVASE